MPSVKPAGLMNERVLFAVVRVATCLGSQVLTNATGFFFRRGERLFLATSRHVLIDTPSGHFPDRLELVLHVDEVDLTRRSTVTVPLYRDGKGEWRQASDSGGDIDVAVLQIDPDILPRGAVLEAFTPDHLHAALQDVQIGTPLLVLGYPLGFYDTLHALPVARQAVVASAFGVRFQGQGLFLTDARMHRGASGAPVVMRTGDTGVALPWKLLGVHSSRMDMKTRDHVLDESLGLNAAWYADVLMTLTSERRTGAADILCQHWKQGTTLSALPDGLRPQTRSEGYVAQAQWAGVLGESIAGWKIAATSAAGQRHINVSGPIAGPVFANRLYPDGAEVSLARNQMRMAECEIVFRFGSALPPRERAYTRVEVLAAVAMLHPGIEVPDSRFLPFEQAGEAQLIADCACCNEMLVGTAVPADARMDTLKNLQVRAEVSDGRSLEGSGLNVLGDPVDALVWLVNELTAQGRTLEAGQFVTTGACVTPIPVLPGDTVAVDYGWLGKMSVRFS